MVTMITYTTKITAVRWLLRLFEPTKNASFGRHFLTCWWIGSIPKISGSATARRTCRYFNKWTQLQPYGKRTYHFCLQFRRCHSCTVPCHAIALYWFCLRLEWNFHHRKSTKASN
jgi:hypothetical protein